MRIKNNFFMLTSPFYGSLNSTYTLQFTTTTATFARVLSNFFDFVILGGFSHKMCLYATFPA